MTLRVSGILLVARHINSDLERGAAEIYEWRIPFFLQDSTLRTKFGQIVARSFRAIGSIAPRMFRAVFQRRQEAHRPRCEKLSVVPKIRR